MIFRGLSGKDQLRLKRLNYAHPIVTLVFPMIFLILFFLFFRTELLTYLLWEPVFKILYMMDSALPYLAWEGLQLCFPWMG